MKYELRCIVGCKPVAFRCIEERTSYRLPLPLLWAEGGVRPLVRLYRRLRHLWRIWRHPPPPLDRSKLPW